MWRRATGSIEGSVNPHDLLRILGVKAVQEYLLKEVLSVYRLQGVAVADERIEIPVAADAAQGSRGGRRRHHPAARLPGRYRPL